MNFEIGPYLVVAAFCEQVIEDKSSVISLIRIVDRVTIAAQGPIAPETMPPTSLDWWFVLIMKSGRVRGNVPIKIEVETPAGTQRIIAEFIAHFEGNNKGVQHLLKFPVNLDVPGVYWYRILVDGKFYTQLPIEAIYSPGVPEPVPS